MKTLNENELNILLNYLSKKPWTEVNKLINMLTTNNTKEKPKCNCGKTVCECGKK